MNPEQPTETQEKAAPERPAATGQNDPRRRRGRGGRGRSRFKRDNRGDRGERVIQGDRTEPAASGERPDRGEREEQTERPHDLDRSTEDHRHRKHSGTIREAIQKVGKIHDELELVLKDLQEVLHALDLAEREKTASDEEIDKLLESLYMLQREPAHARTQRYSAPARVATPSDSEEPPPPAPDEEED
jgi:hypothetical protein